MTEVFLQAVSDHGYLVHAVRADASRAGHLDIFTYGKPLCGKLKGRDAWCMPTLRILSKRTDKLGVRLEQEFTPNMLMTADKPVCIKCAERVAWAGSR